MKKNNIIYFFVKNIIDLIYVSYYRRLQKKTLKQLNLQSNIKNVIDVGAHHGETIEMFFDVFPNLQNCHAFEPYSKSFEKLNSKYSSNKKVKLYNIAISNEKSEKYLNISTIEDGQSTLNNINNNSKWFSIKKIFMGDKNIYSHKELVKTDLLKNFFKNKIDILKIDTEGNELKVLESCGDLLLDTKFILLEIHKSKMFDGYDHEEIFSFLKKNNYLMMKEFKFPFMMWSDVLFYNSKFFNFNNIKE